MKSCTVFFLAKGASSFRRPFLKKPKKSPVSFSENPPSSQLGEKPIFFSHDCGLLPIALFYRDRIRTFADESEARGNLPVRISAVTIEDGVLHHLLNLFGPGFLLPSRGEKFITADPGKEG
jgi:hypothetical protein